jgi:D-alanine-D-alanine ligase-like ATP-grasp enzyme
LLDRLEVVDLHGYTAAEKFNIAKNHIIPKQIDDYDFQKNELQISDEALLKMITHYTRESGVRELQRKVSEILPIVEMLFSGGDPMSFQTYDAKWSEGSIDYKNTYYEQAKITDVQQKAIVSNCLKAFNALGFWGYARFDVRMRDNVPYILETNANPSVYDATEESIDIEAEIIEGIKFPDYLQKIVDAAIWHYECGQRV